MTWIGGILSKVSTGRDELRRNLDLMLGAVPPASMPSTTAYPRSQNCVLDDARGLAFAEVSDHICGTSLGHVYADYQKELALVFDGHLYGCRSTATKLSHAHHEVTEKTAAFLMHLLAEPPGNLEQKVRRVLSRLDGDYALAVSDANRMVVSRDSLGTRPLYLAENNRVSAFASNKKALWKIGLGEVRPLRASTVAIFNREGVSMKKVSCHRNHKTEIKDMVQAVNAYEQALRSAMGKRLAEMSGVREAGVLLSGGVDSCLLATILRDAASSSGMKVIVYTAGLPDSPDMNFARGFAKELRISHQVKTLSIDEVERYIPEVIEAIGDSDFVQVETGIGLYAAMELAAQCDTRVILSGQGPDELWGGYNWYPKVLGQDGRQELCRRMWDDFTRADVETLDRENQIAMAHRIQLLFPYLDYEVVEVAMSVASELKVSSEEDYLGKHPHRRLAIKTGIPKRYANREKLAIQHGTGIHGVLDNIARRNGFDPALVKDIGYKGEKITTEKMGSSARYGYRYAEKELWRVPQHVQLFLHAVAYSKGLLNESLSDRVGYFLERARLHSRVSV